MKKVWTSLIFLAWTTSSLALNTEHGDGDDDAGHVTRRAVSILGNETCGAKLIRDSDGETNVFELTLIPSWNSHQRLSLGSQDSHIKHRKTKTFRLLGFNVTLENKGDGDLKLISAVHIKSGCQHKDILSGKAFIFLDITYETPELYADV